MGLLKVGHPLGWSESAEYRGYVREHGVIQFLATYNRVKDLCREELLWGDEIEYGIFKVDHEAKTIKLSLRGHEVMGELNKNEALALHRSEGCHWVPEYGSWMIEATPRMPFTGYAADLLRVERNMRLRRKRLLNVLKDDEIAPTVTCFPLMGVGEFTSPYFAPGGPVANSQYIPDNVINPHPRFAALTRNIRARRGRNVDIRVPLYKDQHTPEFSGSVSAQSLARASPTQKLFANGDGGVGGLPAPPSPADSPSAAGNGFKHHERTSPPHQNGFHNGAQSAHEVEPTTPGAGQGTAVGGAARDKPSVHMDAMAFGMGCCCLQVTFQARDIDESRFMFDQLAVLAPIMLALTAATPIFKGRLVDTDVRWDVIAASVDDRTPAELGELGGPGDAAYEAARSKDMAGEGVEPLHKSRYDSISTYLHYCKRRQDNPMHVLNTYNDIPCEVDEGTRQFLIQNGVDPALAFHIAHLFVRDPLVIFDGNVHIPDEVSTDHFENIQSTNWQTVRWKPPPPRETAADPEIGWRTEFRSMEVQMTDAENAAFVVFVVLVTRVILAFDLNLYIPLSKVDENMKRAHSRNGVRRQKFFWRRHMAPPDKASDEDIGTINESASLSPPNKPTSESGGESGSDEEGHKACEEDYSGECFEEMSIKQIMLGKGNYYPGLIPLVFAYLEHIGCDEETMECLKMYMDLVRRRATGELQTTATWMRHFVQRHPAYQQDSVVSQEIAHDLLMECKAIGEGKKAAPSLLGTDLYIVPVNKHNAYDVLLSSIKPTHERKRSLVRKYASRACFNEKGRDRDQSDASMDWGANERGSICEAGLDMATSNRASLTAAVNSPLARDSLRIPRRVNREPSISMY